MPSSLDKLTIRGFKSIKSLEEFRLTSLNILIGGNGAGKSNFVEIFRMLRAMVNENFANYIQINGGADDFLFNGPKNTEKIEAEFYFGDNAYSFELQPSATGAEFIIVRESERYAFGNWRVTGGGNRESMIKTCKDENAITNSNRHGVGYYIYKAISSWVVYHFHDTSATAPMKRYEITADNRTLRPDASNIAPFLFRLKQTDGVNAQQCHNSYNEIIEAIKLVTPFFDDFILNPEQRGEKEVVNLSWTQKGSDYPMQPYHFSDGTLRFICLATALLQPDPPETIVIDEPELGLHPYAIEILAELIQAASQKTQVVIATQSPHLIDNFEAEDIIVVNRYQGASSFSRLDKKDLSQWLKEYSLGELWRKNVINGGPDCEQY